MSTIKALVTGATGLIGRSLLARLHEPMALTRNPERGRLARAARVLPWDPDREEPPPEAFEGVDVVFHLAGEPVAEGRWTAEKKRRIRQSRVQGTRRLVTGMARLQERPRVLVSASAVGFYGDRGDEILDEHSTGDASFLAEVCNAWETEAREAETLGIRVVMARIGIVLAPGAGALQRMVAPFKLGLGGRLGNGRQWMPWIHLDDVVGLLLQAATHDAVRGPMNTVSPCPVTNRELARAIGKTLRRPAVIPVPRLAMRLALGELSDVLLASQRVIPVLARETDYSFALSHLDAALAACLGSRPTAVAAA